MSEIIGAGTIRLQADNTALKAGIEDAKRSARALGDSIGNSTQAGAAKAQKSVEAYIQKLQQQAANTGKTASEIKLFDLAQRGATQAQLSAASAALKAIDAHKQQQAEMRRMADANGAAAAAAMSLRGAFAGLSVAAISQQFVAAADAVTNMNARLRLVTNSLADFQRAQREVIRVAQETRTGLGQTADLFTSLSRSTESLGVNQQEVLGVVETINKALIVSGANAQSAEAALVQLGQGFASGTLRGEELNSVLEQAPRLARAIADGLGVTVGQLRQLGQDGKLTAEQVFQAIQKGGAAINSEFSRMPITVGQASTQAANSMQVLIGAIDSTSGATGALAETISSTSRLMSDLADEIKRGAEGAKDIGVLADAFLTVSETVRVLYANTKFVFAGIGRDIGAIGAQIAALARGDFRGFSAISDAVKEDARRAREEVDKLTADILARGPSAADVLRAREDRGFDPLRKSAAGAAATPAAGKKAADAFATELQNLRERLALMGKEGELEKLNTEIGLNKYGKLTAAQKLSLQYAAAAIDAANDEAAAVKTAADARDAATAALTRSQSANLAALATMAEENRTVRETIELLGADERAQAAIANARLQALITTREQQLAEQEALGVGDARLQQLQQEIDLLKERQQLNMERAIKTADQRLKETGEKATSTLATSIEDGILNGFRNSKSLGDIFLNELKAQFAKTVLRPVIQPVIDAGESAAGGLFAKLLGSVGSLFGGMSIDTSVAGTVGGITSGTVLPDILRGGRATGGPVERGGLYRVNERGPELLTVGSQQYLMMGSKGGHVTPNDKLGGGGAPTIINQTTGRVDKATMVTLPDGERALLLQEAADMAYDRMVGSVGDANSRFSRAMGRNYKTERRR